MQKVIKNYHKLKTFTNAIKKVNPNIKHAQLTK